MFTKFTKLFRTTRLIFMAEPEAPIAAPDTAETVPETTKDELTAISKQKMEELFSTIKDPQKLIELAQALEAVEDLIEEKKLPQAQADAALQRAVDGYFSENDYHFTPDEQEKLVETLKLLQKQIGENLSALTERTRALSKMTPWENITIEKKTLTKETWASLPLNTEMTAKLNAEEIKYTGLYELLPLTATKIEANGKTYVRRSGDSKTRGGYYVEGQKQTRENYFAIKDGTTWKITEMSTPTAPIDTTDTVEAFREQRAEAQEAAAAVAREEFAEIENTEALSIMAGIDGLAKDYVKTPDWLNYPATSAKTWQQLLESAEYNTGANRRVIDIIRAKPFEWSPKDLRETMGINGRLSMNEITKKALGMKAKDAVTYYKELQGTKPGIEARIATSTEKIAEATQQINDGVPAGYEKFKQTSGEAVPAWLDRVSTEKDKVDEKLRDARDTENPTDEEAWRTTHKAEFERSDQLRKIVLSIIEVMEKMEMQHKEQEQLRRTEATMSHIEDVLVAGKQLLDAFKGMERGTERTTFEYDIENPRMSVEEQLVESAFTDIRADKVAQRYTMEQLEAEKGLGRIGRTDFLARRMTGESAADVFLNPYTKKEGTKVTVETAGIRDELNRLMIVGIDNAFLDPQMDLVKMAKELGIDVSPQDKEKITKAAKEQKKWARKIELGGKPEKMTEWKSNLETARAAYETASASLRETIKKNLPKINATTNPEDLTDVQKQLIRMGFAVDQRQKAAAEEATETSEHERAVREVISTYHPYIQGVLEKVRQADKEDQIPPAKYKKMGDAIKKGLEEMKIAKFDDSEEGEHARTLATIGAGAGYSGASDTWGAGGGVNIPLENGWSIHIAGGVNGLGTETLTGGMSGGVSKSVKIGENLDLITTVNISTMGLSIVETAQMNLGNNWQASLSAGGALLFNLAPAFIASGSIGVDAEGIVDTSVERAKIASGVDKIEALLQTGKTKEAMAELRKLPQFQQTIAQLAKSDASAETQKAILLATYKMYRAEVGIDGVKDAKVPPISNVGFTYIQIAGAPPILVPYITISIKLSTQIIPILDHSIAEYQQLSDNDIQRGLEEKFSHMGDAGTVGEVVSGTISIEDAVVMGAEGRTVSVTPSRKEEILENFRDLEENLEAYNNDAAKKIGVELEKKESAYKMHFGDIDNAFVEIHLDPLAQNIHLAYGAPEGTPPEQNILLAFDPAMQDLIITREEFILPYSKEGKNKVVMFTIKENPARSRTQIQKEEKGYLDFSRDLRTKKGKRSITETAVMERRKGAGATQNNIGTLTEQRAHLAERTEAEQYGERLAGALGQTMDAFGTVEEKVDVSEERKGELEEKADAYLKANPKKAREITTRGYDFGELIMNPEKIKEDYPELLKGMFPEGVPEDTKEIDFVLNYFIVQTFQTTKGIEQFNEDLRRFFRPMLQGMFAETEAGQGKESVLTEQFLELLDLEHLNFNEEGTPIPEGFEGVALVGTKKITGLRGMSNFTGNNAYDMLNMVNLNRAPQDLRNAILELVSPIPAEDKDFLDSSLGVKLGFYGALFLGVEKGINLANAKNKIRKGETLTTEEKTAVTALREVAEKIRRAENSGQKEIVITNGDGLSFVLVVNVKLLGGVYGKCGNPTFMAKENFSIGPVGRTVTAENTMLLSTTPEAHADILKFVLGFAYQPKQPQDIPPGREPPGKQPPEEPEPHAPGIIRDESVINEGGLGGHIGTVGDGDADAPQ